MNDNYYDYEAPNDSAGNSESFERRLKLKNTATGIALLTAKLMQGKPNSNNQSSDNFGRSGGNSRSKK